MNSTQQSIHTHGVSESRLTLCVVLVNFKSDRAEDSRL